MVDRPSAAFPVWFVTSPTRRPFSGAKSRLASTSIPHLTARFGGVETLETVGAALALGMGFAIPVTAEAARVATIRRNGVVEPALLSGWRRLVRMTT